MFVKRYKYTLKYFLGIISVLLIVSCMKSHVKGTDTIKLHDTTFTAIMIDVLLMEAYVNEKLPNAHFDSLTLIKKSFYDSIFSKYHTDSAAFFSTVLYYQAHPDKFFPKLKTIDSIMNKIIPGDTTTIINQIPVPDNIQELSGFSEQEEAMRKELFKNRFNSRKVKQGKQQN